MGRTNPTFRDTVNGFERDWQDYRRTLRRTDQEEFDRLVEGARTYADAAGTQNPIHPQDGILLSMLLSVAVKQRQLEERLAALESDS